MYKCFFKNLELKNIIQWKNTFQDANKKLFFIEKTKTRNSKLSNRAQ